MYMKKLSFKSNDEIEKTALSSIKSIVKHLTIRKKCFSWKEQS